MDLTSLILTTLNMLEFTLVLLTLSTSFTFPLPPLSLLLSTPTLPYLSPHLVNTTQRLNKEEELLLRLLLPSLLLNTNLTLHLPLISVKVKVPQTLLLLGQGDLKVPVT